jgi:hypothetical protein
MAKPLRVLTLGIILLILPFTVRAQTGAQASLGALSTEAFPSITSTLDVRDEQGQFVTGLSADQVTIYENDQALAIDSLTELRPGAQLVVAFNAGTAFAVRDSQALTRYDHVREALEQWALGLDDADSLSLMTNTGFNLPAAETTNDWLQALSEAPSDFRTTQPNFQILSQAIQAAAQTTPKNGMGRAVLFVTQNPEQSTIAALESFAAQANDAGVRVNVWMVSSKSFFVTSPAIALQELAVSTGGQFFAFSGDETFPDLESYFEPIRNVYAVSYTSQIINEGTHQVAVAVDSADFQLRTAPQPFELMILPPNPILVSPPSQIFRALVEADADAPVYDINQQAFEILIEFPDGFERSLVRTTLYVNGQIVDENTSAPFDTFVWDLSELSESGRHVIQVEAVDELGMSQITLETPVELTVQRPPEGIAPVFSENSALISTVVVLLAGSILLAAMIMVIRARTPLLANFRPRRRQRRQADPVYQAVDATVKVVPRERSTSRLPKWAGQIPARLHWPQKNGAAVQPVAFLEHIYDPNAMETLTPMKPIPITTSETTLGGDPNRANLVLEDPSVAELHARLRRDTDGSFYLQDNDSISGTWINYVPANAKEVKLEHGDLIHFGRVGFRFKVKNPPRVFEPVVIRKLAH